LVGSNAHFRLHFLEQLDLERLVDVLAELRLVDDSLESNDEILKRRLEMLLQLSQQVIQKVPVLSNEFLRDFLADLFKDLLLQVFMHNQNICYQL
jgi:hypothetical protein